MNMSNLANLNFFGDNVNLKQLFFDVAHPIGDIYVQYPQQPGPEELYNDDDVISKWIELVKYNGAFFRSSNAPTEIYAEHGDTEKYYRDENLVEQIDISGLGTVTVSETYTNSHGVEVDKCTGDWTTGLADPYINKTDNLVVQEDQFQGHRHSTTASMMNSNYYLAGGGYVSWSPASIGDPITDGTNGAPRYGKETRPTNFTVNYYQRIL